MYIVGSIYIKWELIIVLIEPDLGHEMGYGFEDLISKMVREKSFFNMLLLILFLLWLYSKRDFLTKRTEVSNGCLTKDTLDGLSDSF